MLRQQHRLFRHVLIASDTVLIALASVIAYNARFYWLTGIRQPLEQDFSYATHCIPVFIATPIMLIALLWGGLYQPRRDQRFFREAVSLLKAIVIGLVLLIATLSMARGILYGGRNPSSLQFAYYGATCLGLLMTWRYAFRAALRSLRSRGWNLRHIAIIGTGRLGRLAHHTISRNSWTGLQPRFFISHLDEPVQDKVLDLPVRGGLADLRHTLEHEAKHLSGVVIALPGEMTAALPDILAELDRFTLDVRIVPDMNPRYMPINMAVAELDGMPVLSVRESPLSGWGGILKRILDMIGGLAALLIFAIPMIIISILVRRSGSGPVIFRQERMSMNGRVFRIFKFRTMSHVDAEQQKLRDRGKGTDAWTKDDDPRITAVGRFLRKTSLDELPQLFNVLLGEMSLVGPRPERPELIDRFREDWRGYMLRQNVKAGMTGWAQVNGLRGDTSLKKRLQYDLFYVRNWSIMFDIRILWLTLFRGFAHKNAV